MVGIKKSKIKYKILAATHFVYYNNHKISKTWKQIQ